MAAGWACRRIGVPDALGYILAGVVLGPHVPPAPFVNDMPAIQSIAAFAVVFRMFTLGLDFNGARLMEQWRPATLAALFGLVTCALAGLALAPLVGLTALQGLIVGTALGTTSTTLLVRALAERGASARADARAAGAVTLAEDLASMGILIGLALVRPSLDAPGLVQLGALVTFLWGALTVGGIALSLVLDRLARHGEESLLTLCVMAFLLGCSGIGVLFAVGPAVGAFFAGVVVAGLRHAPGVSERVLPLRDVLTAVFFVSVGMLLDPRMLLEIAPGALALTLVAVPVKAVATACGLWAGGIAPVTSGRGGAILAQCGTMGIVVVAASLLSPADASRLFGYAFIAWALTTAATGARLRFGPAVAERLVRALGGTDHPRREGFARAQPPHPGLRVSFHATGVALACIGLGVLVVRVTHVHEAWLQAGAGAVAGIGASLALLSAVGGAGDALRPLLHRLDRSTTSLQRGGRHPTRTVLHRIVLFSPVAVVGVVGAAVAPPWVLIGAAAGGGLVVLLAPVIDWRRWVDRFPRWLPEDVHDQRVTAARIMTPFGSRVATLRVTEHDAGMSIAHLEQRFPRGVKVLGVIRPDADAVQDPLPSLVVTPRDELVIVGPAARVARARESWQREARAAEPPAVVK